MKITALLLVFLSVPLGCQTFCSDSARVRVIDAITSEPIEGASVRYCSYSIGGGSFGKTDSDGSLSFVAPLSFEGLKVTMAGYQTGWWSVSQGWTDEIVIRMEKGSNPTLLLPEEE